MQGGSHQICDLDGVSAGLAGGLAGEQRADRTGAQSIERWGCGPGLFVAPTKKIEH